MATKPQSVDEYIAQVEPESVRQALAKLRGIVRESAPDSEEVISYGIPTYKQHGHVASIAAYKNHCSFFPGHTVRDFSEELKGFKVLKGTVQLPHGKPLPEELIRAMVMARVEENCSGAD